MSIVINKTTQEIFDDTVIHFSKQKKQALGFSNSVCRYRGDNGTSCAIGCHIPDSEYRETLEEKNISYLIGSKYILFPKANMRFLEEIQLIHDESENIGDLKTKLKDLTDAYGLNKDKISLITEWNNTYETTI